MSALLRPGRLDGKIVIVTGAGNGIGRAVAVLAAMEGGQVALFDYDEASVVDTANAIGAGSLAIRADVSDIEQTDAAVTRVVQHFGRLDVLINVAGVHDQMAPNEEVSPEMWDRIMDINLRGSAFIIKRVLQEMLPAGSGAIVNTASTAALVAGGGGVAYTASKGALLSLTRQVAYEVADRGVRVNAVAPGSTATGLLESTNNVLGPPTMGPMQEAFCQKAMATFGGKVPMGRAAEPEEIARPVIFLASDDASYITGHTLVVDGGYSSSH